MATTAISRSAQSRPNSGTHRRGSKVPARFIPTISLVSAVVHLASMSIVANFSCNSVETQALARLVPSKNGKWCLILYLTMGRACATIGDTTSIQPRGSRFHVSCMTTRRYLVEMGLPEPDGRTRVPLESAASLSGITDRPTRRRAPRCFSPVSPFGETPCPGCRQTSSRVRRHSKPASGSLRMHLPARLYRLPGQNPKALQPRHARPASLPSLPCHP